MPIQSLSTFGRFYTKNEINYVMFSHFNPLPGQVHGWKKNCVEKSVIIILYHFSFLFNNFVKFLLLLSANDFSSKFIHAVCVCV